jgi:hypothetical protein
MDDETRETILRLWDEGMPRPEIVRRTGAAKSSVYWIIKNRTRKSRLADEVAALRERNAFLEGQIAAKDALIRDLLDKRDAGGPSGRSSRS